MPQAGGGGDNDNDSGDDADTKQMNESIAKTAAEKKARKEAEEAERLSKLGTNITSGVGGDSGGAGVLMLTTKPGDATHFPKKGDTCRVHYVGTLDDGTIFDSSRARQQAFAFPLGKGVVVRGIDEAVKLMSKGQEVKLTIPPMYGYGGEVMGRVEERSDKGCECPGDERSEELVGRSYVRMDVDVPLMCLLSSSLRSSPRCCCEYPVDSITLSLTNVL